MGFININGENMNFIDVKLVSGPYAALIDHGWFQIVESLDMVADNQYTCSLLKQ